jgi:hypothetical protein
MQASGGKDNSDGGGSHARRDELLDMQRAAQKRWADNDGRFT